MERRTNSGVGRAALFPDPSLSAPFPYRRCKYLGVLVSFRRPRRYLPSVSRVLPSSVIPLRCPHSWSQGFFLGAAERAPCGTKYGSGAWGLVGMGLHYLDRCFCFYLTKL